MRGAKWAQPAWGELLGDSGDKVGEATLRMLRKDAIRECRVLLIMAGGQSRAD